MTAEELQAQISAMRDSIKAQQEKLDELEKQLDRADELDDIDKPLKIEDGKEVYIVTTYGKVYSVDTINTPTYQIANNCHRLFKSEKYAEMYRKKTQFIADLIHFKWLYDRDYEPDWSDDRERKYFVVGYHDVSKWVVDYVTRGMVGGVYFSSQEIAQKCADWLNRKAGII